jgi:hypothetical protein
MSDSIAVIVWGRVNIGVRMTFMKGSMEKIRLSVKKKVSVGKTTIAAVLRFAPYTGTE